MLSDISLSTRKKLTEGPTIATLAYIKNFSSQHHESLGSRNSIKLPSYLLAHVYFIQWI